MIFDRRSISGCCKIESRGDRESWSALVLVDISSPRSRTRSYVKVKCELIFVNEDLTVAERPPSDRTWLS